MVGDASLGFRYFSLQIGYGFLRLAGRTGYLANRKPSIFQGLHGVTVLLELNPVSAIMWRPPRSQRPDKRQTQRKTGLAREPVDVLASLRRPWWSTPLSFRMVKDGRLWLMIGKWRRFSAQTGITRSRRRNVRFGPRRA